MHTLCAFSIVALFSKIRFFQPGCAPASPAALFLCSSARIRQDIGAASFCSCHLLWRIDECVLPPCFNVQPDIFAVMNCYIVALGVFYSDSLSWSADSLYSLYSAMTHKIRRVDVEKYAYYVNKLRQNVDLEIWLWRQIVTSQTAHTKYKWPPYATEWNPPMKIFCVCHCWQLPWFAHASQLIYLIEAKSEGLFYQELRSQCVFVSNCDWF